LATKTGIRLLSALRRSNSVSALAEINPVLFADDDELAAFHWMRNFVTDHGVFPGAMLFARHTGIETLRVQEPLAYHVEQAYKGALYRAMRQPVGDAYDHLADMDADAALRVIQGMLRSISDLRSRDSGRVTLSSALDDAERAYNEAAMSFGLRGVTTGWQYVDTITAGFQNSDLISLVARPGRGKTYYLLYMAWRAWLSGRRVLFVSMELDGEQLARRAIGMHSGINPDFIRKGRLDTHGEMRFRGTIRDMKGQGGVERPPFDIIVGDFDKSVDVVRALAHELTPDIIYVDASYLLLPEPGKRFNSRREMVADVIGDMKRLNLSIRRPIVQTLQFNREAVKAPVRRTRRDNDTEATLGGAEREAMQNPLSHLSIEKIAETDVVGQASSLVLGLEKHPTDPARRYMGFLKGREGESGWWNLNYSFNPVDFSWRPPDADQTNPATVNLDFMVND
jgi:replicative DNA helicase